MLEAIRKTRSGLPANVPLIGFAGAPFTLASYVIEGGGSRDYMHTKALMWSDPGAWHALMEKLTAALVSYLNAQVHAGAQALQVFDSWVGCLCPADYTQLRAAAHEAAVSRARPERAGDPLRHRQSGALSVDAGGGRRRDRPRFSLRARARPGMRWATSR